MVPTLPSLDEDGGVGSKGSGGGIRDGVRRGGGGEGALGNPGHPVVQFIQGRVCQQIVLTVYVMFASGLCASLRLLVCANNPVNILSDKLQTPLS